jgi:hypothetical protein
MNMRKVDGFPLWIGTARDARDIKGVLDAGIEAVVDLAIMSEPVAPTRELVYLRFPLLDGEGNPLWLIALAAHSVANLLWYGVPTLVACDGGMSRSLAVSALAVCSVSPPVSLDEVLRQLASTGPADVHPALWADVKRSVESVNESRYRPRE